MSDLIEDSLDGSLDNSLDNSLAQLVMRGGIYYNTPGGSKEEVISNIIDSLPVLPAQKNETLLQAVIEREALISTGNENGIALPHPRTLMLGEDEDPFVAIAFPEKPLDWGTPDGSRVHTVFLIVSKSPKQHLGVISKINFLCQQEAFFGLILKQSSKNEIITMIETTEKYWR
jgi:PTS system nitrogen regulatory IIA component